MQIEILDPCGFRHFITSRNPETLGRWIIETYAEITNVCDQFKYPPRILVYPSFDPETNDPDWILDSRIISQPIEALTPEKLLQGLASTLDTYRNGAKPVA